MPLEIQSGVGDPPEVRELKETVRKVADIYTAKHGWCDAVNRALAEAGIDPAGASTEIIVDTAITVKIPLKVDLTKLADKTEEEQNELIAEKIKERINLGVRYASRRERSFADPSDHRTPEVQGVQVDDMNVYVEPPGQIDQILRRQGITLPDNVVAAFTSSDGRVIHLFPDQRGYSARCGAASYGSRTRSSTRSEDRLCQRCRDGYGV